MNLIADIGNTAVKASLTDQMTLGKAFRYQGEKVSEFIVSLLVREKPDVAVISSVYGISEEDEKAFRKVCPDVVILDKAHTQLLESKGIPSYLTYDRASSIVASRYLFGGKPCTIVDLGTTLTVDFLSQDGKYEGGNVSLGYRTRFKAINRYSRALPLVDSSCESGFLGSDLQSSIRNGVVSGMEFEIGGYIASHPDNVIVFTGGDANFFAKRMKNSIFVVCNLVLMGLALIADEYVNKKA